MKTKTLQIIIAFDSGNNNAYLALNEDYSVDSIVERLKTSDNKKKPYLTSQELHFRVSYFT